MYTVILVTAKNKKEANKISNHLIKKKLVACVNVAGAVESVFHWQGKIEKAKEVLLIIKTKKSLIKKIIKAVKALHSYSVPEVIALPIIDGNADYLKWIRDSVK